jgi:hypothetical protein
MDQADLRPCGIRHIAPTGFSARQMQKAPFRSKLLDEWAICFVESGRQGAVILHRYGSQVCLSCAFCAIASLLLLLSKVPRVLFR